MGRISFNQVCSAIRSKYPDAGVITRLRTNSGNSSKCGVIMYREPGNDRIFTGRNNSDLLEQVNKGL